MSTHTSLTALASRITANIRAPQSATTLDLGRSTYTFSPDLNGTELQALADLEAQALAFFDSLALSAGWWTAGHVLTATDRKTLALAPPPAHPDLATHTSLGLSAAHAHPYEASGAVSTHAGLADPHPGYLTPAEGNAAYAPTHSHPYEASGAVATHAGLADPHPVYLTAAEGTAAYEPSGAVSTHAGAGNPHPVYATDTDLSTHAAGPHGGAGAWTLVMKTADESKNNLAVVADDLTLVAALTANAAYHLRLRAFFLTNATADLKYRLVFTGATTRVRRRVFRTATTDIAQTIELKTAFDAADVVLSTTGLNPWLEEDVILQVGASGGSLKLQWAQGTSGAGPTTCLEGSYLEYALS